MKGVRLSERQILAVLKEGESGVAVAELLRQHGINQAITNGNHGTVVEKPANCHDFVNLKPRTPSSSACTPILP